MRGLVTPLGYNVTMTPITLGAMMLHGTTLLGHAVCNTQVECDVIASTQ